MIAFQGIVVLRKEFVFTVLCAVFFFFGPAIDTAAVADEAQPERGPALFQYCVRCHTIRPEGEHRYGPNLHGLMDRGIASIEDFAYSAALSQKKNEEQYWTPKTLNAFLAKPHMAAPGTKMAFKGLMNPHDRADLLAWLIEATGSKTLADAIDDPLTEASNGDATRGARLFQPCRACHSTEKGAPHEVGPNLFGLMGRGFAAAEGFDYGGALAVRKGIWTPESLDRFLQERKEFRQGTHRAFETLIGPIDRADLIAFIATLKD